MERRRRELGPEDSSGRLSGLINKQLLDQKLLLISGKGGTGKSVLCASLALLAQRQGRKVLTVAMGGSEGLAAHLSTGLLEHQPREIRPGLWASGVDRSKALLEYLAVQIGLPMGGPLRLFARAFDALASTAPGVREVVTMGKVLWEVKQGAWDLVIVDGPPTGQLMSHLRAPRTIRELVPTGRVRQQAEWMEGLLLDPAVTSLILVSLLEELPASETQETIDLLEDASVVPAPVMVANRVLAPLEVPVPVPAGAVGEAALLHQSLWEEQQLWGRTLTVDAVLPFLFGLVTPGEVAARLADCWEDQL